MFWKRKKRFVVKELDVYLTLLKLRHLAFEEQIELDLETLDSVLKFLLAHDFDKAKSLTLENIKESYDEIIQATEATVQVDTMVEEEH